MPTTITVLSQKGGTGKTTAVRTLAELFRRSALPTLAIDLDPQGSLSDYFDVPPDAAPTVAEVLTGQCGIADAIYEPAGVVPANLALAEAERSLAGRPGRERVLQRALRGLPDRYDLVLVDCPPSLGLLTVNGVGAANYALITAAAQYFSRQGVAQAVEVVRLAQEQLHPGLHLLGILLNLADLRTVHSREAQRRLQERYGKLVFRTAIRASIAYAEAAEAGLPIIDYRPDLGADYSALAREILERLGRGREVHRLAALLPGAPTRR